jgi:hypothetical protein
MPRTLPTRTARSKQQKAKAAGDGDEDFDRLFRFAVEWFGSEKTVRTMLSAGTLKFKLPRKRPEPGRHMGLCGAYARSTGKPCEAPGNGRGGRCKLHGGKSTGPRTEEGLKRLEEAVRARWRAWRAARGEPSEY